MKPDNTNSASDFEAYRNSMHQAEENGREVVPAPKKAVALVFGLLMVVLYVGMGVLLIINFFHWEGPTMQVVRYIIGVMLILYGIFRAYRYVKGSDYYNNK